MANYNKSFNFRNGVQVDSDNFIVNANGLVGIGTSIPTDLLDVYGTAKVTGLVTTTNLAVTGVSSFYSDVNVGSGITLDPSTGSVRATTFFGSAAGLTEIYAIAVDGWHVNAGNISTTSKVGIGTTLPYYSLQVGQDPITGNGLSIDDITGNLNTTGIINAPSFVGNLTGNVYGNIESIGVSTFSTLKVGSGVTITDGIVNSNSFVGNITGNINSNGVSTFSTIEVGTGITISGGIVTATSFSGPLVGNVTGNVTGIASTALTLPSSARISITSVNSAFTSTGIATVTDTLYVTGFPAKIGVGTVTAPEADIEVNKTGISSIRVISNNNIASIGIGRSAEIRTGDTDNFYPYSNRNSLDIINFNAENVNYYLDYGSAGVGTGNFNWIHGQNPSSPLMSVTYAGNLGLGITDPSSKLYVAGTSYITGITTINNNLDVNQSLYVNGNITFTGSLIGDIGVTTLDRLGISTDTISTNSYEFFVGGDPILGEGVSITKTSIRASGVIQSTNIISTNINNTGIITSSSFVGTLTGNVTGNVTGTASTAISLVESANIVVSSVGIETSEPIGLLQVGSGNEFGTVVVATASTIGVSTTIIAGINTSGITLGLTILEIEDIIGSGTTVVSIGAGQVGIGTTTLNTSEENDISLNFGTGYVSDRVFVIDTNKSIGIGTINPTSKLTVRGGDISVGINTSNGLVLTSPNGTQYRLIVNDAGALSATAI